MSVILKAENISKQYRLGLVGTGALQDDLKRFWYKVRGKEDPFLKVGDVNDRSVKGSSKYVWALQDVNFEVKKGEVLGIIGKNGAGKSTLLKILSRVTNPTTGEIKTKGRIASLLEVGTGFHPELTGRENIYLNGAILGMTKAEIKSKEDEIIDFSGCDKYVDTPVKRYSSGMRVRLAFAVAAFLEPDILVIDEVLAVGDAEFQKKAIGKMQDISKGEGRTVLFVSHNMESIQKLCTRCIVMSNGSIVFEGNVDKSVSYYLKSNSSNEDIVFPIQGKGIELLDFKIIDYLNEDATSLILGKPFIFQLNVCNKNNTKNINVRLQIFDTNETLIATLNTFHLSRQAVIKGNMVRQFTCKVQKLSIGSGEYFLGIQILNLYEMEVLYENNKLKKFEILNGDFYGSGKLPTSDNLGKILLDHSWSEYTEAKQ
ncbi:ABC transporter ATP-binding protein [Mangrovimonas aestuarii]|uniref:ABC transporter ATP-binding protein n=1 Tax=Mangrovimonas aestuarii TaxID=3018443 RepID=UPI0023790EB0|nr:ABC transporter ATP-binding protein [Mangrovimonas aestuarii]